MVLKPQMLMAKFKYLMQQQALDFYSKHFIFEGKNALLSRKEAHITAASPTQMSSTLAA